MTHRWTVPLPVCWAFVSRLDLLRQLGWFSWGMRMPFFYLFWKISIFFLLFLKNEKYISEMMKLFWFYRDEIIWLDSNEVRNKKTHQGGKVIFQPLKLWVTEKSTIMNTVNNVWVIEICYIYLFTEKGDKDSFGEELRFLLRYLFFILTSWKEP